MRPSGRKPDQLREIHFETGVSDYAEGSCMVTYGRTKVLCTASVEERPPVWLRNTGKGWVTAEYGMLPRATHERTGREAARGKQGGRTVEIQRLIGRSLRSVVDLKALGERQITIDCDVINADGGTRTASISGGFVALHMALKGMMGSYKINKLPISDHVAAVSCGLYQGNAVLDLDYAEDSNAAADANFVLTARGGIVEIQGTAEHAPFSESQFTELFTLAKKGVAEIVELQKAALEKL